MLLAIDTSTSWASVALFNGANVLGELSWRAPRRHGDELFPMLERLLELGQVRLADVDRLAVATGPGSFAGIRIGIATARGIARGNSARATGVSTLDVLAFPHAPAKLPLCALLPAGKDEWYAAFYEERDGVWARRSPYVVDGLAAICQSAEVPTLFVGELDAEAEGALSELSGARARFPTAASRARRAGYLAELGWRALEERPRSQSDELEPIYVKSASVRGFDARVASPAASPVASPAAAPAPGAHTPGAAALREALGVVRSE